MKTLNQKIFINQCYTRSINLLRDADSEATVTTYIPTTRSLQTLRHIASTFEVEQIPRAYALTGPYGSGKSLFAIFLSHLLSNPKDNTIQPLALSVLQKSDSALAKRYQKHLANSIGYCRILLTGSPAPLGQCLLQAIYIGARAFWHGKRGASGLLKKLKTASETKDFSMSDLLALLIELQDAVAQAHGRGVLIVFDELGKFLEYQARHPEVNDIHCLQLLAEHTYQHHLAPLHIVVLLHQSFEQYARGLGKKLTEEWQKIQGRFESIAFLEATEQMLRIVKAAFRQDFRHLNHKQIKKTARQMTRVLAESQALPGYLDEANAIDLFMGCYPLHPISLLLLPRLCQKVAQNERTLFSYLGSQELYGFQETLTKLPDNAWILPWSIYDYFLQNQITNATDLLTHHRWIEVMTALERLGEEAPVEQIQLLKTIGLLNIIGSQGGLKASKNILTLCHPKQDAEQQATYLTALQKQSYIHFRKFNNEYRVWQGTDFDLNAVLQKEISQLSHIELANTLNERQPLSPIVARRITIETGTLRYFVPYFMDAESSQLLISDGKTPRILFYLANSGEERAIFEQEIKSQTNPIDIIVFSENIDRLRDAVIEVMALLNIAKHYQALNEDPVAQREYQDCLQAAEWQEQQLLKNFIEMPQLHQWYWQGKPLNIINKRHWQTQLSQVMKQIYHQAPMIPNELINRDKPSNSANSGRNRLLNAMLNHAFAEDLDIEKFPAEKSMYRALLQASGLHRPVNQQWQFAPPQTEDPYCFKPLWQVVEAFLKEEGKPQPLNQLYSQLQKPPYGVKAGVLPILFTAYYLTYPREIALYEEQVFCPTLTYEHLEILAKRPEKFTVERFQIAGMRFALFEKYLQSIIGKVSKKATLLDIVRPLAKFMKSLPVYTQYTNQLTAETLAVREALIQAQSPAKLLFEQLPMACGYQAFTMAEVDSKTTEQFMHKLILCLRELKDAYDNLLKQFSHQLSDALQLEAGLDLAKMRVQIQERFNGLEHYTVDKEGLIAFIHRLQNHKETEIAWLESIATFLGKVPPTKWREEHQQQADYRLAEFSNRLHDLVKLHSQKISKHNKNGLQTVLIRTVRPEKEIEQIAYIDPKQQTKINETVQKIQKTLDKSGDHQLQLAVLAELFDRM